ncbi:MAG: ATP-binding protein [Candidatus Aenigmatarchaeota archaeon]
MKITQIIKDQFFELEEKFKITKVVDREAKSIAIDLLKSNLVKVTTGIRRSGKSFFTYSLLKGTKFGYVNFDDEILANYDTNSILSSIFEVYGKVNTLFFDEIQNLKNWELFVNRLHRAGFNVFITGSNAKLLSKELATALTGRHINIEIYPFSFREYLKAKEIEVNIESTIGQGIIKKELKEYLDVGGFPEILVNKENPKIYLRNLFNDIIEKDIIRRYRIKYSRTFKEIALNVVSNFSRYLTYNSIKKQFNLGSDHTAKNYLEYLKEAYIIVTFDALHFKPKEIIKSPKKVYLIDTGFIRNISISFSENFGLIIENLVAIELLRKRSYWHNDWEIYYFKDYQQNEVDFVIKEGIKIKQLIQVTYASSKDEIEKREIKALLKASNLLKCKDLMIITWDYEDILKIDNKEIKCIPLWKWLLNV